MKKNVIDLISQHVAALEALDCVVIVWTEADMPGKTLRARDEEFETVRGPLQERSIEFGFDLISSVLG